MKKRIAVILGLVILATLLIATPAYADTPDPDSTPTVEAGRKHVYRNLLETGDYLYIYEANIPYAALPATPVNQTFIWRLVALDGVTVLGQTVGYAYNDDGYGYNVYSMYFSAADATAAGMVWGTAYILRLSGNPAAFLTPPVYNFNFAAGDYTTLTASADNQVALATEILTLAADLNIRWGLATDYFLNLETETGTALSLYGENVFRGAIYGCQALAPQAFRAVVADINAPDRAWNTTYITSLETQNAGTWVETARNASIALFGTVNYDLGGIIALLIICVVLIIGVSSVSNDHWTGLIDAAIVLIVAARMGVYGLGFLGLLAALSIFWIGAKIYRNLIPT
jgi:hypothetical protein